MKDLLENIESHLQDGKSKLAITNLVSALDARRDSALPAVLKEKLDLVKNNPLEAKDIKAKQDEIEEMIKKEELDPAEAPIELLEVVFTTDEINKLHSDGITLAEFQKLGVEINKKVFGFKYFDEKENYVYKEIDSHKEMAILSFYERKTIRKLSKKIKSQATKIFKKLQEAQSLNLSSNEEELDEAQNALAEIKEMQSKSEVAVKELNNKAMEYSRLDKKELTEWEQNLAVAKVIEMAEDRYTPPMGKN